MKTAALKTYQSQWRTNEQWATIVWSRFQDILSPLLEDNEEMDGKLLDSSLKKDKVIKNNLNNYNQGTDAIRIMCREYKPTIVLNGKQKKVPVKCYITLLPLAAEPVHNLVKSSGKLSHLHRHGKVPVIKEVIHLYQKMKRWKKKTSINLNRNLFWAKKMQKCK